MHKMYKNKIRFVINCHYPVIVTDLKDLENGSGDTMTCFFYITQQH